jgi:hypothetical protein
MFSKWQIQLFFPSKYGDFGPISPKELPPPHPPPPPKSLSLSRKMLGQPKVY